jgi:type II secretory pathway component PulJ
MLNCRTEREAGFSLFESLVAFTVLTLILVASFQVFGTGTQRLNHATEAIASQEKLQNALAQLQAGLPANQLDKDVRVELHPLQDEAATWTTRLPYHVVLMLIDDKGKTRLESVILRDAGAQP